MNMDLYCYQIHTFLLQVMSCLLLQLQTLHDETSLTIFGVE